MTIKLHQIALLLLGLLPLGSQASQEAKASAEEDFKNASALIAEAKQNIALIRATIAATTPEEKAAQYSLITAREKVANATEEGASVRAAAEKRLEEAQKAAAEEAQTAAEKNAIISIVAAKPQAEEENTITRLAAAHQEAAAALEKVAAAAEEEKAAAEALEKASVKEAQAELATAQEEAAALIIKRIQTTAAKPPAERASAEETTAAALIIKIATATTSVEQSLEKGMVAASLQLATRAAQEAAHQAKAIKELAAVKIKAAPTEEQRATAAQQNREAMAEAIKGLQKAKKKREEAQIEAEMAQEKVLCFKSIIERAMARAKSASAGEEKRKMRLEKTKEEVKSAERHLESVKSAAAKKSLAKAKSAVKGEVTSATMQREKAAQEDLIKAEARLAQAQEALIKEEEDKDLERLTTITLLKTTNIIQAHQQWVASIEEQEQAIDTLRAPYIARLEAQDRAIKDSGLNEAIKSNIIAIEGQWYDDEKSKRVAINDAIDNYFEKIGELFNIRYDHTYRFLRGVYMKFLLESDHGQRALFFYLNNHILYTAEGAIYTSINLTQPFVSGIPASLSEGCQAMLWPPPCFDRDDFFDNKQQVYLKKPIKKAMGFYEVPFMDYLMTQSPFPLIEHLKQARKTYPMMPYAQGFYKKLVSDTFHKMIGFFEKEVSKNLLLYLLFLPYDKAFEAWREVVNESNWHDRNRAIKNRDDIEVDKEELSETEKELRDINFALNLGLDYCDYKLSFDALHPRSRAIDFFIHCYKNISQEADLATSQGDILLLEEKLALLSEGFIRERCIRSDKINVPLDIVDMIGAYTFNHPNIFHYLANSKEALHQMRSQLAVMKKRLPQKAAVLQEKEVVKEEAVDDGLTLNLGGL